MRYMICAILIVLTQTACSSTSDITGRDIEPLPWSIGKYAPDYMEAYVKGIDVIDERGEIYYGVNFGHAAVRSPETGDGTPAGWPRNARGSTNFIKGAALPRSMAIVWHSLVEPQAYMLSFDMPGHILREMKKPQKTICRSTKETITSYRNHVAIGLAPGGIAKISITGYCLDPIEVGRYEAINLKRSEELQELYGESRFLRPETIKYLENNPIPYGSW